MGEEIVRSSAQVTNGDLEAIAVYLKDQPGMSESRFDVGRRG